MSGTIVGFDLTVADAPRVRDFYAEVIGWHPEPLDMGGYADYVMRAPDGNPVAGVCHARGGNADLPPQWLAYIAVTDLATSLRAAVALGGEVVAGPKGEGMDAYAVIRDPAGAVLALVQRPGGPFTDRS